MTIPDFDTLFLIGAGADEEGWPPVLAAINEVSPEAKVQDAEEANAYFARNIYLRRLNEFKPPDEKAEPPRRAELRQHIQEEDLKLKKRIAHHLRAAHDAGKIKLRSRLLDLIEAKGRDRVFAVTTNWDMLLENHVNPHRILHLHGAITTPEHLYLPTETAAEPYRDLQGWNYLGTRHALAWKLFAKAQDIVVYGLSFSALDAELCFALSVGFQEERKLRRVHIVDCKARIKAIENRLRVIGGPGLEFDFTSDGVDCT